MNTTTSQALCIIANAMNEITDDKRYHSADYCKACLNYMLDLYSVHGFEHMPDLILQHIEKDSRCVFSIALELKA